ncbi:MAG: hypothetical protein HZA50_17510 [Planctomycetes bacterium]|nr:hypothetical protein [Planctomycetota bacterium]
MSIRLSIIDGCSRLLAAAVVLCASSACLAQKPHDASASTRPAAKPPSAAPATRPSDKAVKIDDATIRIFRETAEDWAEKAKKFAPILHLIETQHFLIYSAWEKNQDKGMSEAIENMYRVLCQQFVVDAKDQYWAGKLPIFVMATKEQFTTFTNEIDKVKRPDSAGYCGATSKGFAYIVTSQVKDINFFYELVIHESTHAFLNRYKTNVLIVTWINEGIADYMAATLVPNSIAHNRYIDAARMAIAEKKDVQFVFREVKGAFAYGIAQSLIRYLIQRDGKAFLKFIKLMKEGKTDDEALKEAYKLTKEQLVAEWNKAAAANAIK